MIAYTIGIAAMLMAFAATPANLSWMQWATVFMIGFFLYGPQVSSWLEPVLAPCPCWMSFLDPLCWFCGPSLGLGPIGVYPQLGS